MDISDFNHNYLSPILEKLLHDNKSVVLLGDFNGNPLKHDSDSDISNFLDLMSLNALLLHITCSTRITSTFQTLTDNIFTNESDSPYLDGNNVTILADHQAQFVLVKKCNKSTQNKESLYLRDY